MAKSWAKWCACKVARLLSGSVQSSFPQDIRCCKCTLLTPHCLFASCLCWIMGISSYDKARTGIDVDATESSESGRHVESPRSAKSPLSKRILAVIWDSLDKSPEERALIAKLDWFILSNVCVAYFVKYLDQTNVSNDHILFEMLSLTHSGLQCLCIRNERRPRAQREWLESSYNILDH